MPLKTARQGMILILLGALVLGFAVGGFLIAGGGSSKSVVIKVCLDHQGVASIDSDHNLVVCRDGSVHSVSF